VSHLILKALHAATPRFRLWIVDRDQHVRSSVVDTSVPSPAYRDG